MYYYFQAQDFLALLERMQSQRLDDQRCEMPDIHVSFPIELHSLVRNLSINAHSAIALSFFVLR